MSLKAGAKQVDISPKDSQFLYGYPYVERYSTGINDPLISSALYLDNGDTEIIFVANDIIYVSKALVSSARNRIAELTAVPAENIMISATHTHSGPMTINNFMNKSDSAVPTKADAGYVRLLEDGIVAAAVDAYKSAQPAKLGFAVADSTGIGTNRRDPNGASNHDVPVLLVKSADGRENIACMLVCSMHPTVLHEDSKLVSADFPGYSRKYMQDKVLGGNCPILHHSGACGNQSPRHVTKSNTFDEAKRIGEILGKAVEIALNNLSFEDNITLDAKHELIDLPRQQFLSVEQAKERLERVTNRFETLKNENAQPKLVRTAECDWFGANRALVLAEAAANGMLEDVYKTILPAEVQVLRVGKLNFVGFPCEIFTDYALELKKRFENTFVVSLANGVLQGYIVTKEAFEEGGYEACCGMISYKAGDILVDRATEILKRN